MRLKLWHVFLASAVIAAGAGGVYMTYVENARQEAEKARIAQEELVRKDLEQRAAFEKFLNGFLQDVNKGAQEYKQRRQVLASLVLPQNLKTPEYAQENASLAESTVLALHIQMDEIMSAFAKADQTMATLASGLSEEGRAAAEAKWQAVHKQRDQFAAYFTSERDILTAYKALADFYAQKKDGFTVDALSGELRFSLPEDQEAARALDERIAALSAAQAELLQLPAD